jgi:hypothetical protein
MSAGMVIDCSIVALLFVLPPACFVLSVVALALAGDPPAQAPRNVLRTWKLLGASLIPLLLVVASNVLAPIPTSSSDAFESDVDVAVYFFIELLTVATPIVLSTTWFRGIAPTHTIYVLMTIVAISVGVWFALANLLARAMIGC